MNNLQNTNMNPNNKPSKIGHAASKIPTSGRDSGTHSRSSSVSNLTTASDIRSEVGDSAADNPEDFKVDERVWFNGTKPGCIKFIGKTQFAPGIWAGVLLDEPHGKNDGSVAGVQYFTCEPLRGIFARPAKLARTPGALTSSIGDSSMVGSATPKSTIPSSRASVTSNMSGTSPSRSCCSRLRVGERITVSSLNGVKSGILKFIGETDFAKGEWAGIELDEPTGKNDGSVAGKRYFTCKLKHGLFSPLHKVSRAGGTPVSRPASVRGTPLMRSNSRDSLSSSISNSSRASRVKLGVTSLTQKNVAAAYATPANKALQDALKEKDQHIEQLLKEKDLDRAEFAKVTSHFEEFENMTKQLEKKQKSTEADKKNLEGELSSVQRKLEDIQFQLEEEKIARSEFEMQLQQKSIILKRIEDFITTENSGKFLNIKELLAGKETLSEIEDCLKVSIDSELLEKKVSELELVVKRISAEKEETSKQLSLLRKSFEEASSNNGMLIEQLNTSIQEKDDMITTLKKELNNNIEKVTHLIEDNKNLSDQILLKEEQAKGHADDVIKELGERVKTLNEEIKSKSGQLLEISSSNEEKDQKISSIELNLNKQIEALSLLQNKYKEISEAFSKKEIELEESDAIQKSLKETIVSLKSELENNNNESTKHVSSLEEDIKTKTCQLSEYLNSIEEKENLISSLQKNFDFQAASLLQLQNEKKDLNDCLKQKELELEEKATKQKSLEEQIGVLTSQTESTIAETQQKMLDLVKEIESLSNCVQEKEDLLLRTQADLDTTKNNYQQLNEQMEQLSKKLQETELNSSYTLNDSSEKINTLQREIEALLDEKNKAIEAFESKIKSKEDELLAKSDIIAQHESQISLLSEKLKKIEEDHCILKAEISSKDEKMKDYVTDKEKSENLTKQKGEEIEALKQVIKAKEEELTSKSEVISGNESQIAVLTEKLKSFENNCSALKETIVSLEEKSKDLLKEKESLENSLKVKDETIVDFTKQVENLKKSIDQNNISLEEKDKQLLALRDSFNLKEEENNQLASKLQLAEQNVEMLNKDSSDHVMALQNELSKIKEESTDIKTHLEQDLAKVKQEKEKLSVIINEKDQMLSTKEEALASMKKELMERNSELSSFSAQNAELLQNLSKSNSDIEELRQIQSDELNRLISEHKQFSTVKEQELTSLKDKNQELLNNISDKDKVLAEKEEILSSLQNTLEEKEAGISDLSSQNSDLSKTIAQFKSEIDEQQRIHKEKLDSSFVETDKSLQEKDVIIEGIQNDLKKQSEVIENKTAELNKKENEINNLKSMLEEKEAQFEQLSKTVEAAGKQFTSLKEQNEKNEALLQSKESFIIEFKNQQEKQLLSKEKVFKEEVSKLESTIKNKDEEMKLKGAELITLSKDSHEKDILIDSLKMELDSVKSEKEKMLKDSGSIHQEFKNKISELEEKCSKILEDKEKITKEEELVRNQNKNLEMARDSLMQEKSAQEEIVKERNSKIDSLQAEVSRMQAEFSLHKEQLLQKLKVNETELQASLELKNELEVQHSVVEELQLKLKDSEEKCKELEAQTRDLSDITAEKNKLQADLKEFQKINKEKSERIAIIEENNLALEDLIKNNKNLMSQKESELSSLKEQLNKLKSDKNASESLNSLKSLEEENAVLKMKIAALELVQTEKNLDSSAIASSNELSTANDEEKESLKSQVDFLNSIIVDMKQKNEELSRELELQRTCWEESDINLNETTKTLAPRLFCDICDMFDLHETDDCPKQESNVEEEVPQLRKAGTRKLEERPYCNNCEVFGHWTLDCDEQETF